MLKKITQLKKKSLTFYLVSGLVIIAAILRLYNLPGSMMFLGDQGRDAMIVKDIFTKFDPVFIGPVTSVGNMYLGPLYYYFMLPWLMLSYPSPVGPAYGVALMGILTVFLIYYLGRKMIGQKAALVATLFFALSSTVVNNTRFSWNPNPAPIVSLLMVFFTWKAWRKNPRYWILVALCFGILIQLHYLTLLSAGGAGIIGIIQIGEIIAQWRQKKKVDQAYVKKFATSVGLAALLFLATLIPLFLFDLKHDLLNAKAFLGMITGEGNFTQNQAIPLAQKAWTIIQETHGRGMHILFEISIGQNRKLNTYLLAGFYLVLAWLLFKRNKENKFWSGHLVIATYLITGIIGTSFYGHTVFDHYIAYLFPITFLTFGMVLGFIWQKHIVGKLAAITFFIYFLSFNLTRYNLATRSWSIFDIKRTTDSILEHLDPNEPYNIVLLSETKDLYGQSYRYYLETSDHIPLKPAQNGEADTLVIIDEHHQKEDVTTLPIYEITTFGDKKIVEVYNVDNGPEITIIKRN